MPQEPGPESKSEYRAGQSEVEQGEPARPVKGHDVRPGVGRDQRRHHQRAEDGGEIAPHHRRDLGSERLWLWQVSDNLRKGAATNAIQIAEEMVRRGLR